MKISDIFDENGNFKERDYDPWRVEERFKEIHEFLFDDDGYLNQNGNSDEWIDIQLLDLINIHPYWYWGCDAVKLYHAQNFALGTKGNYGANTAWR